MKTPQECYEQFFRQMALLLKALGFQKKGKRFFYKKNDLVFVFAVFSTSILSSLSFKILAAVFHKSFQNQQDEQAYLEDFFTIRIHESDECRGFRFFIAEDDPDPEGKGQWITDFYAQRIREYVMPIFSRLDTVQDVIDLLLETPKEKRFWSDPLENVIPSKVAELYWLLGEKEKAIAVLDDALQKILARGPLRGDRELCYRADTELRARILNGGPFYTRQVRQRPGAKKKPE